MPELNFQPIERRDGIDRRPSPECDSRIDAKIAAIRHDLRDDITEIRLTLKELSLSLTKLVLLEERQTQQLAAMERIFKALEKIEGRVSVLETKSPQQDRTSAWVDRGVLGVLMMVFMYAVNKLGLGS